MIRAESITNINWAHPEDIIGVYRSVYADVKWTILQETVRQLLSLEDVGAPHVLKAYADVMNGVYGPIGPYIPPPPPPPVEPAEDQPTVSGADDF